MNESQLKILSQVNELLSEHFDAHIVSVLAIDDHDEERRSAYAGGKATALGLVEMYRKELLEKNNNETNDTEN
jgi:hypothetical protein